MSSHQGRSAMNRRTAESLLRGDRSALPAGDPLTQLLAAAKAPATAGELAGEDAAMAAFRAAVDSPATPTRRVSMIKLTLAKLLTVKVAAIAFATTATVGGVALASATGALPNPITSDKPSASASPSKHAKPTPAGSAAPRPSRSGLPPRLAELCQEFAGKSGENRRRALDEDRFAELVERAGRKDRDHVYRFCVDFGKPDVHPSGQPEWGAKPGPKPSGSAKPGNVRPSDKGGPSGSAKPSDRPGGDDDKGQPQG
ncbi:hypothetical protein AB0M02_46100 [Actinoplanes sp. NPDC051861]|uniref:hypothetical protein n=1 Tax=Actinoplanes sp. NPDC051861 TaxID=3155170 RepID=UPI003416EB92